VKITLHFNSITRANHQLLRRPFQFFFHSLPHAIAKDHQRQSSASERPRSNAFKRRPYPKCLRILHNRGLRRCSPDRSLRSNNASYTQRERGRKRSSSVCPLLPTLPKAIKLTLRSVRGRPHYYSAKKEEYAIIKFSLSADLSSLFTWNTKQIFVYVSASWPNSTSTEVTNEAVIWDTIITNPSADHLQNIGPVAMKKLIRSAKGKSIDPSRQVKVNLYYKR